MWYSFNMSIHTHEIEVDEFLDRFFVTLAITFESESGWIYPISATVTQLSGETYDKTRGELVTWGWAEWLDSLALEYVCACDTLYEDMAFIARAEGGDD